MTVKVGIPRALLYYTYFPMWQSFFNEIGAEVVTSGKTTKEILDKGVREALADACVPIKLFFGHVMELQDRVDCLFIPRVVCLNKKTVYCPKFLGLPDMIKHSVDGIPPVIDIRMDTRQGHCALYKAYKEVGKHFNAGKFTILRAYLKAKAAMGRYNALLRKGWSPPEALALLNKPDARLVKPPDGKLKFAVLGYPYAIYDSFISVGLLEKLRRLGVSVLTAENIHPLTLALQRNCNLPKRLFWTFSDLALKAAHHLFKQGRVDGVLHLTAFGCGPDSLLNKFIELEESLGRIVI
ncbi:MAG: acyl-CoA dehydratase activase-related protein [Firmicutes bacterium]|nr:acyl-CoA dehydratase activase-related protein [Bacillota bacterium]